MTPMLKVAAVVMLLSACTLYDHEPSDEAPFVDAAPAVCVPSADRNTSCRTICSTDIELCAGADWTVCLNECRAGVASVAWCPGGFGN